MRKIIVFLLSLAIVIAPSSVFAGAAEKWDYDVKPDTSQKLDVKGHKVDGYGNAANDYEYNRKIDPKTAANRTKMGKVGMGRLLRITGWGLLGAAALEGLLESVDWILDPEAQSIWRYKKGKDDYSCSYRTGEDKIKIFVASDNFSSPCPYNVALRMLDIRGKEVGYPSGTKLEFVAWDPALTPNSTLFRFTFNIIQPQGGTMQDRLNVNFRDDPAPASEKEILTPDQLADYANHTHPDFSNPELAPKLEPHYSPSIQTDLWKPANPWEYDNSPTVDEVKKELEQAKPEPKDDKIKENEPDPETGAKSFSLPAFCSWATTVCDFIDWSKKEPETQDKDDLEIETPTPFDNSIFTKDRFQVSRQCPVPEQYTINLSGVSVNFSFDMTPLCKVLELARPALIACSYLYAAYIVIGAARNG